MSEPVRLLHFADLHVGMENYGGTDRDTGLSTRVVDFIRRMDEVTEYAASHQADLIIFAGDAFKTRAPNPTFQREFAHRVRDLSQIAPVVMLVGNHDLPLTQMRASSVEIFDTLAVPNVWVAGNYEVRQVETARGSVAVGSAPYPLRARLLEQAQTAGMTVAQTDARLQEQLVMILDELAAEADTHHGPRVLTGHFTVSGAVMGSERGIMLGRDVAVPREAVADPRWDYVALGHIHKHQNLTAGRDDVPPVVYSGSLERIDFGEEGDPKGFCWVEMERGATRWSFVPLSARPFVTLKADLRADVDPTHSAIRLVEAHDLRGAIVRMILQLTPESESRFNEMPVREALKRAGAVYVAAIRKEVEQPARARLGASPEGLTHAELLERYLISTGVVPARRAELLDAAESIFRGESRDN
jgi:exonuclease SbcD